MKNSLLFVVTILVSNLSIAQAMETFKCWGTEPFWSAELTDGQMKFGQMGSKSDGKNYAVTYASPGGTSIDYVMTIKGKNVAGFVVNGAMNIVADEKGLAPQGNSKFQSYCSDGMSNKLAPFSIHLFVKGQSFTGCCETLSKPGVEISN